MISPARRVWLYPVLGHGLEILVFGSDEEVGALFPALLQACEAWRGFERVDTIVQGGAAIGVSVKVSPIARYVNSVTEAINALRGPLAGARFFHGHDGSCTARWT